MSYVYVKSELALWTVGFYSPAGTWYAESDHPTPEAAAQRCHWLNGGPEASQKRNPDSRLSGTSGQEIVDSAKPQTP